MGDIMTAQGADYLTRAAIEARVRSDFDSARELLDEAYRLFPDNKDVLHQLAVLMEATGDYTEATKFWRLFASGDTPIWWALTSWGRCLYLQGDPLEAAQIFAQTKAKFPLESRILIEHVRALRQTEFLPECALAVRAALDAAATWEALELWEVGLASIACGSSEAMVECARRLRETGDVRLSNEFLAKARWVLSEVNPARLVELDALELGASQALMMNFESLGGDYPGCEIGLIQRKFGAEPIGLLRWATTTPHQLIEALKCQFEGVGTPEQTEVRVALTRDYKTTDKRFGMDMLTFVMASEIDAETMHRKACQRISFLRNKLIADLSSGEKIFLYRSNEDSLSFDGIVALKEAMSAYGKNRLLYVRPADSDHPPGSIEHIGDGLMIGRVVRFSRTPVAELFLDGWLEMLRAAL